MATMLLDMGNHPKHAVRAYIVENLFLGDDPGFDDEASLLEEGALDSTAAMELVSFLEDTFNFKIADEEINPDNLDSVNRIVALIERKHKASQ
jgi:acyl carrier protein